MKKLIYKIEGYQNQYNQETKEIDKVFIPIEVVINNPTDKSIEIAKEEAYNGEYIIEDDGVEEIVEPTQLDIIEAQVAYTAMMTDTLLEV